ncbi:MAG: IS1380 family transposase [Candidatus Andersenbacteria bacterium]|nr:IS1380 family transposase [Candidatus Andersenbacteria bacterium]MBI3442822.1 IS1380 family transposase [Candidatus Sungbacteria bacterium]
MPRTGAKNVQVAFSAGRLTHFGGVYLLHAFLQQLQIRTFLSRLLRTPERNNHFSITERLFALLYPMILGLEKIELSALLGTNGVFQYLTGLPRFPNPTTLRRFLVGKSDELLPKLHAAHNALRAQFLAVSFPASSICLDFDSTTRTLYGNQEGAAKGYNPHHKGKKSYHPLICTEAHRKECLGGALRYGNAHTAAGVKEMLREVLALLPRGIRSLRTRADSGFYDGDFVAQLSQNGVKFAIVAHMTAPVRHKVPGLRYQKVSNILSTAEFPYKPHDWDKKYRFVVLREKLTEKRDEQLTLFKSNAYSYHVIVTNLPLTPYGIFTFYEDRAGLERIIRIAKDDYSFGTAPTNNFKANALYAELSMLAYNLVVWFKFLCLPDNWQSYTVGTLRHKLLLIPGIFTKTGNRPSLKLPKNCLYQNEFLYAQKRIGKLKPLV